MLIRPEDFVGKLFGFLMEWFFQWALMLASGGLLIAYFLAEMAGWSPEPTCWMFAVVGFAIGARYDLEEMRQGPSASTIAVFGYLGFAAFVMGCEVLFVLSALQGGAGS